MKVGHRIRPEEHEREEITVASLGLRWLTRNFVTIEYYKLHFAARATEEGHAEREEAFSIVRNPKLDSAPQQAMNLDTVCTYEVHDQDTLSSIHTRDVNALRLGVLSTIQYRHGIQSPIVRR
ncbi:hypothetical protein AXG93_1513s1220 [Marchantia polymorpha subsp. ruderalis]|uniref:Uncharacterized protein n=1 Tax=Marchantia polymorpha subsp. ruderalis TaxID=1480154 RepID=A0A176WCF2_MARPO|nr:hypothetical protein AXG93_1513s1220 [Marchantia polymorpha subsp. ruderalis]